MFKSAYVATYLKWGIISAIAFCIPMIIFVATNDYTKTWYLYIGNALFLVAVCFYMLQFSKMKHENASTQTMMAAGHITTIFGIILSVIVSAITLGFYGAFGDTTLDTAPSEVGNGVTQGMVFFVFMNATIGNFCGGSFSSIIVPYTAKRDQTKDKKSEVLNN